MVPRKIKLRDISEQVYFRFLADLSRHNGLLFTVATDSYLNTNSVAGTHRKGQADKVRINIPSMKYDSAKEGLAKLADDIDGLSDQLYIQLQCQIALISDALNRGILYYVQRDPVTLRRFVWRIDQKNSQKTTYERAFETVLCPILQSISFREPMIQIVEEDYSYMEPFMYAENDAPKYVEEAFGKKLNGGVNIGKIIRDDMQFPDSKNEPLVQIADLLASGVRRCLRSGFKNNKLAAQSLGRLMLGNIKDKWPILFVGFHTAETNVDDSIAKIAGTMNRYSRGMIQSRTSFD